MNVTIFKKKVPLLYVLLNMWALFQCILIAWFCYHHSPILYKKLSTIFHRKPAREPKQAVDHEHRFIEESWTYLMAIGIIFIIAAVNTLQLWLYFKKNSTEDDEEVIEF